MLAARGIGKSFGAVRALHDVALAVGRGEVVAVVGENGAGKSTLMKILAGIERPDRGQIEVDGQAVEIEGPRHALALGIALLHQELCLADNLDVAANVFLGREPARFGWLDGGTAQRRTRALLETIGLDVSPRARVADLSPGQRQMVEIARALSADARLLIFDEPTSSLSQRESDRLFAVVRDLKARGVAIVWISHRLGEVSELADRVVVLRDGENAGALAREEISHDAMVRLMVGREIARRSWAARSAQPTSDTRESGATPDVPVLEVDGLVVPGRPGERTSFVVRAGEKVGLAGLVGAGRTELLRVLFGLEAPLAGSIRIDGEEIELESPTDAIARGIALVPEDRQLEGLLVDASVGENLGLPSLAHRARAGVISPAREKAFACEQIAAHGIRVDAPERAARDLSGGNQQKVVLAKWLALGPRLLLLDEPTRGIDVAARNEIHRRLDSLAAQGIAILFASSEMEEVLTLADRILVLHEGRLMGELAHEEASEEAVVQFMVGPAR